MDPTFPIGAPIKRSEIDSLPVGAPIKRSELGGVTPTPEPQESTLGKIIGFAKGIVTEDIPAMAKGVAGAATGAFDTLQQAGDIYQNDPSISSIPGVGQIQALGRAATDGMTADDLKRIGIRTGMGALGAVGGAMTGGLLPAIFAAAVGTQAGGEINEEIGLEPNTSWLSWEKAKQLRGNVTAGVVAPAVSNMAFRTAAKAGRYIEKNSFRLSELKKEMAKEPGIIAARLSIGARRIPSERILVDELREGQDTFIKAGVIQNSNTADDMLGNLNTVITENSKVKTEMIDRIDQLVAAANEKKPMIPLIEWEDIKLPKVQAAIDKRRNSPIGKEVAAEQAALLKNVEDAFQTTVVPGRETHPLVPAGDPYIKKTPKTLREVQDMLDITYEKLRELKHFDDATQAAGAVNPSVVSKNLGEMEFYKELAGSLRGAISKYADTVKDRLPQALGNMEKGALGKVNTTIHHLIPYRTALERFSVEAMEGFVRDTARSLRQQSPFNSPGSMGMTKAVDIMASPVTAPINEASQLRSALNFKPEVLEELKTIAGVQQGTIQPSMGGQAMGAIAGTTGRQAATAADAISSPLGKAATINTLDFFSDPLFEQHVAQLPIPEEVKAELMAAKEGTERMQVEVMGKAKIAAKGTGVFEKGPIPGVASWIPLQNGGGRIADKIEREHVRDLIEMHEVDPLKRMELKDRLNKSGTIITPPDYLLMQALEPSAGVDIEVPPESEAVKSETPAPTTSVGDGVKRQSYDY